MESPAISLGVESKVLDPSTDLSVFTSLQEKLSSDIDPWATADMLCGVTDSLCETYYLRGEWRKARRWGEELLRSVEYYFFGDWPHKAITDNGDIDPEWWYSNCINWVQSLASALCWGAVFDRWEALDRPLGFPTEEVSTDPDEVVARAYYIALAKWWADHSDVSSLEEVKAMRGAGSKQYHLQCDVLQSISAGDADRTSKSMNKYLKFWLKRMKTSPQRLAKDASFLWHVARREGLAIELPPELTIHMPIVPKTILNCE